MKEQVLNSPEFIFLAQILYNYKEKWMFIPAFGRFKSKIVKIRFFGRKLLFCDKQPCLKLFGLKL